MTRSEWSWGIHAQPPGGEESIGTCLTCSRLEAKIISHHHDAASDTTSHRAIRGGRGSSNNKEIGTASKQEAQARSASKKRKQEAQQEAQAKFASIWIPVPVHCNNPCYYPVIEYTTLPPLLFPASSLFSADSHPSGKASRGISALKTPPWPETLTGRFKY